MPKPSYERATRASGTGHVGIEHHLTCGHSTKANPVITGKRTLWACPEGCGFMERNRNAARNAA